MPINGCLCAKKTDADVMCICNAKSDNPIDGMEIDKTQCCSWSLFTMICIYNWNCLASISFSHFYSLSLSLSLSSFHYFFVDWFLLSFSCSRPSFLLHFTYFFLNFDVSVRVCSQTQHLFCWFVYLFIYLFVITGICS